MGAQPTVVGDAAAVLEAGSEFKPTVVIDSLGGEFTASAPQVLAPRGRLVLFGTSAGGEADDAAATAVPQTAAGARLRRAYRVTGRTSGGGRGSLAAMARGDLRISIGAEFALDAVEEAFATLADHVVDRQAPAAPSIAARCGRCNVSIGLCPMLR